MTDVSATRDRVQAYLTAEGPVQIDAQGRLSFDRGTTRVFVSVAQHSNGEATMVTVTAPILFHVPLTPELFEYVALNADNWYFGHFALWRDSDDESKGLLALTHALLGDFLDKDELLYAVYGVLGTADGLDDDLQAKFGGQKYSDT